MKYFIATYENNGTEIIVSEKKEVCYKRALIAMMLEFTKLTNSADKNKELFDKAKTLIDKGITIRFSNFLVMAI
jgi:hypothetical protein